MGPPVVEQRGRSERSGMGGGGSGGAGGGGQGMDQGARPEAGACVLKSRPRLPLGGEAARHMVSKSVCTRFDGRTEPRWGSDG